MQAEVTPPPAPRVFPPTPQLMWQTQQLGDSFSPRAETHTRDTTRARKSKQVDFSAERETREGLSKLQVKQFLIDVSQNSD